MFVQRKASSQRKGESSEPGVGGGGGARGARFIAEEIFKCAPQRAERALCRGRGARVRPREASWAPRGRAAGVPVSRAPCL
jgi:hypothetical protein